MSPSNDFVLIGSFVCVVLLLLSVTVYHVLELIFEHRERMAKIEAERRAKSPPPAPPAPAGSAAALVAANARKENVKR